MKQELGKYSALKGKAGFPAGLFRHSAFKLLKIFPVPGVEILLIKGFDPFQKNIEIASTPRHANVFLVSEPLPEASEKAAAIAFAQMPRPRMLVFVDMKESGFLPPPDLIITAKDLKAVAKKIHPVEIYNENAAAYKPGFLMEALSEEEDNGGHQRHHGHQHGKGDRNSHEGHENHEDKSQEKHQHHAGNSEEEGHGKKHQEHEHHDHGDGHNHTVSHDLGDHDHDDEHDHGSHKHDGGHEHGGHDHDDEHEHGSHKHDDEHDHGGHDHCGEQDHDDGHEHGGHKHDDGHEHGGHKHDDEHDHDGHKHDGEHDHGGHKHDEEHEHGSHKHDDGHEHGGHDHDGQHEHGGHDHGGHDHGGGHDHSGHDHGGGHDHSGHDHGSGHDHSGHDHGSGHDHSGHDHGSGGFMSMVMMTKDQPRGTDGLQMDRNEVRFGPFHPGLPGGLQVKMTIAGDTVAQAEVEKGLFNEDSFKNFPEEPKGFPDWLAGFDPFQTNSHSQLALLAFAKAANSEFHLDIRKLEKERVQNLLLWLLKFQITLGDRQMERKVFKLWQDFQQKKLPPEEFSSFRKKLESRWYLKSRLRRLGSLPKKTLHHIRGPVAKAAGNGSDLREDLPEYGHFRSLEINENNAWGWLLIRLEEISQSLQILNQPGSEEKRDLFAKARKLDFSGRQESCVKLETSRGVVVLKLEMVDGKIRKVDFKQPSTVLAAAVPQITQNCELADALVTIAALDISPWEINM